MFAAAKRARPGVLDEIARGEIAPLNDWLRENVWSQASLYTTDELLTRATGEKLSTAPFRAHLERRYGAP